MQIARCMLCFTHSAIWYIDLVHPSVMSFVPAPVKTYHCHGYLIFVVYVYGCLLQDLEQARMEAAGAKQQVEEQRVLSVRAQEEAHEAHSSITILQQQAAEAEGCMAAATAAWNSEREALEAAAAAAAELASADEVERRVQATVSGEVCIQCESPLLYACLASELLV